MVVLNSLVSAVQLAPSIITVGPTGMWEALILNVFGFITNYGWRIVVFTLVLKLVLSPLDFYQRYKMSKNQKITERLKPTMENLKKQCGGDEKVFSQKQMELNRKEGYSYFASCLPMIVTLIVFFTMFSSMRYVSQYMTIEQYVTLYDEYQYAYEQVNEQTADEQFAQYVGQSVVYNLYYDGIVTESENPDDLTINKIEKEIDDAIAAQADWGADKQKTVQAEWGDIDLSFLELEAKDRVAESWLYIKNVWSPDVPWSSNVSFFGSGRAVLDWKMFVNSINKYDTKILKRLEENNVVLDDGTEQGQKANELFNDVMTESKYNTVMSKLLNDDTRDLTNGYLVLPIVIVLLSVASQLITTRQQKKAGQDASAAGGGAAGMMKAMMFIMPVMMAFFALQSAAIFSLYMVTNSAVTLMLNLLFSGIIKLIDMRRKKRNYGIATGSARIVYGADSPIIHYVKGANPDAGKKEVAPDKSEKTAGKTVDGKKSKKDKTAVRVVRDGRPDPHVLMGYDMNNDKNQK